MPKNKHKQNAFYFFMLDWKKQEENKGRHFPNGLKDVQLDWDCNQVWKNLPKEDKDRYKEKEKTHKIKSNNGKKTCHGESIAQLQQADREQEEFLDTTKQYISSLICEAKRNKNIQKLKFFVIHINYFYGRILDNNEMDYYPAEVAIAEFCLEEGITRTYHSIIRSKIQMGYSYEASEHSKNTHQIPTDITIGEEDYSLIYKDICDFLLLDRFNGKPPILFTRYDTASIKYPVMNVLKILSDLDKTSHEYFTIYSFEELFANLYNALSEDNTNLMKFDNIIASLKLKNDDPFDYKRSIQCEFHKVTSGGGNHCSKSLVQRWIFVLFSYTCNFLEIKLYPKFHIPEEDEDGNQSIELNSTFANLSLNTSVLDSSITTKKSIRKQEKHASERTYKKKQHHRLESMAEPLIIIDHSNINETSQNQTHISKKESQRPPFSNSCSFPINTVINSSEDDFPSLGRGCRRRGRSNPLKSILTECDLLANTVINADEDNFPSLGRGCRDREESYPIKL